MFIVRSVLLGKTGIKTAVFGLLVNFILFIIKLYIGISSNSLSIYCDAVNNLGDTLSCVIVLVGFILVLKLDELRGKRTQALASFVIGLILVFTGAYFAYNGLERCLYPVKVSFSRAYAALIAVTILVKLIMGIVYIKVNQKKPSPVFRTLILDSFLDCAVTAVTLIGFTLTVKINFSIDGIVSVIIGSVVAISAAKEVIRQTKLLINE